jgi:hypothetical protein
VLRRDVFIAAMKLHCWKKLAWSISAFALVEQSPPEMGDYPFQLFHDNTGHYVWTGEHIVKIEDASPQQPLYHMLDAVEIDAGDIPNNGQKLTTTYGNLLFNWLVMIYAFGEKLPYQQDRVSPDKIKQLILPKLVNQFEPDGSGGMDKIFVSELIRYKEALYFLRGFANFCVWSATKKVLLPPPGIKAYRDQLLKENEGKLNELATIADIGKKLVAFDAEWLKGDPGGDNFVTSGKPREIVRAKKFLMHGAETGFDENGVYATLIPNSLHEGWDLTKFPQMNDSLRAGSFSRGSQTMLGGVQVKLLRRATANMMVTIDDCGSRVGSPVLITPQSAKRFTGFTFITEDQKQQIKFTTPEDAQSYLGQVMYQRNPRFCRLDFTDYCKTCVGDRLAANPTGLSAAVSELGSAFLGIFMSKMHGKSLKTAKVDYKALMR